MIKVSFRDPNEKLVNITHQLQLYSKDGVTPAGTDIVSEFYDEFLLSDPFPDFNQVLIDNPYISLPRPNPSLVFHEKTEEAELKKVASAHDQCLAKYKLTRRNLALLEDQLTEANVEISQLENLNNS